MQLELFEIYTSFETDLDGTVPCRSCGTSFPHTRDFFHLRSTTAREGLDNKDYLFYECKKCRNEISRTRKILRDQYEHTKTSYCQCCKEETDRLCLDHNHTTDVFRGWLCNQCNTGIGLLGDNLQGLEQAIAYLRKTDGQS